MTMTGQCLCGAVTFTAEDVDLDANGCHCGQCRRWAGGTVIGVIACGVGFSGTEYMRRYESSEWAERAFCGKCGSSLFYRQKKDSDRYFMPVGVFDDQSAFRLASEVFIDAKPPGYAFVGDHPRKAAAEFMASLGKD